MFSPRRRAPVVPMTTAERIELLGPFCRQFPELGLRGRRDLQYWLSFELGNWQALDQWVPLGKGLEAKALSPRTIYHVLAGNLAISGWQSLLGGLLLGSLNRAKIPRAQEEAFQRFFSLLPSRLQPFLAFDRELDWQALRSAEAVIAFGTQETIQKVRENLEPAQTFVAYGPRASLIWLGKVHDLPEELIDRCAYDIALYGQLGCLSPQSILVLPQSHLTAFCHRLAEALRRWSTKLPCPPPDPVATRQIQEARTIAHAMGWPVWTPGESLQWTVILRSSREFSPSFGYRLIYVDVVPLESLEDWLRPLAGSLSTVASPSPLDPGLQTLFVQYGAWRFCAVGKSQCPFPWAYHDGRPRLAGLVRWILQEPFVGRKQRPKPPRRVFYEKGVRRARSVHQT